jgi:hypothetical protein
MDDKENKIRKSKTIKQYIPWCRRGLKHPFALPFYIPRHVAIYVATGRLPETARRMAGRVPQKKGSIAI